MTVVDLTIVNVALPITGSKLHFHEPDLQSVVTAYALAFHGVSKPGRGVGCRALTAAQFSAKDAALMRTKLAQLGNNFYALRQVLNP